MTNREIVADTLQGHAREAAIRLHERGHWSLLAYPDGSVLWAERVSANEWSVLAGTTTPVASLLTTNNSVPCNCDACVHGDDPRDWASNDSGDVETVLNDALDQIKVGYFDDEQMARG